MLHVLNLGMGVDSVYCLVRWLLDPSSRTFPLSRLIVLIAQTGDEFLSTRDLIETYLFPMLRQHNIRTIQVARGGSFVRNGYRILADTRQPHRLHIEGAFKLSEYLLMNGTTIRVSRPHTCAQKWKGWVLDKMISSIEASAIARQTCVYYKLALHLWQTPKPTGYLHSAIAKLRQLTPLILHQLLPAWILQTPPEFLFGPYICYSAEEEARIKTADEYGCRGEQYIYPNMDVPRAEALDYLFKVFGVHWEKSCCVFCPFQAEDGATARYLREPYALAYSMFIEAIAIHFNPRMYQFGFGTAWALAHRSGNTEAQFLFHQHWENIDRWALYHVRRITWLKEKKQKPGEHREDSDRCISIAAIGTRSDMDEEFHGLTASGATLDVQERVVFKASSRSPAKARMPNYDIMPVHRAYLIRQGEAFPLIEEFYMVGPAIVKEKVRNAKQFELDWHHWGVNKGYEATQPDLFSIEVSH